MQTKDFETAVAYIMDAGYIRSEIECETCNRPMKLIFANNYARFKCRRCCCAKSIFDKTIFFNSKKNLLELIDLVYFWSMDIIQSKVAYQANTKSNKTVGVWFKKLSKLTKKILIFNNSLEKIGGLNRLVQIDESKFSKRKFEVGRTVRSPWIVGFIDVETREVRFVETFYRDADTLRRLIGLYVAEGSIIVTDCWAGYRNLESLGMTHMTVNHSTNFVDPITGANTQLIECTWGVYKRKFRSRGIKHWCNINDYFIEFMFRIRFGNEVFEKIMENLYLID